MHSICTLDGHRTTRNQTVKKGLHRDRQIWFLPYRVTTAVLSELCYTIADPELYRRESRANFGSLVGLHYLLAALYALHMYTRWSCNYKKSDGEEGASSGQAPATFSSFTSRIRMKLFVFSVANIFSNLLIGTSWLLWLLGNLFISYTNDRTAMQSSIKVQVVCYAIFPAGVLCFLIGAFAFSDKFVALCISKGTRLPWMRLLSPRYIWIPLVLFIGIAVSGYAVLGYQVQVGQLQQDCFKNEEFYGRVSYLSSGALFSFDYNCSSYMVGSSSYNSCTKCNLGICKLQEVGTLSYVIFLVFYLVAVAVALISALRIWLQASRQLASFVRSLVALSNFANRRNGASRGSAGRESQTAAQDKVMNKPFALVWLGLMVMVLALTQRIGIILILVASTQSDSCERVDDRCGPCDTTCRTTAEVLSNWILLDPNVFGFSSMTTELLISAIMGAIQLWLESKESKGSKMRAAALKAKSEPQDSQRSGQDLAFVISMEIGQSSCK